MLQRAEITSERWMTPPEIFDPLMEEFTFDLDAASIAIEALERLKPVKTHGDERP